MTNKAERDEKTNVPPHAVPRKPYVSPTLRVYGDVAALTRTVGNKGTVTDNGSGGHSKTS